MQDEALKLLIELADESPWRDVHEINVCAFCDRSWRHREDYIWLKIHAFVLTQGVAIDPIEKGTLPGDLLPYETRR